MKKFDLDILFQNLLKKKGLEISQSYTASLLENKKLLSRKVGEEAIEVVVEFLNNNKENLIKESSDLLYHLTVVWISANIQPNDIWKELFRRTNQSGITEKKSRKK